MPDWKEQIAPDEEARFQRYASELRALQTARPKGPGGPGRALHLKAHVGAVGEVRVGEVPAPLAVGPFAKPGTFPLYVRFSNGSFRRQPDAVPDVRGIALKLVGVPGKKVIPGLEDKSTQDFLLIPSPALPVATPGEFIALLGIVKRSQLLVLPRLLATFGFSKALRIIKGVASMPAVSSMASLRVYTAAPQRFGDEAVKLSLVPLQGPPTEVKQGPEALRDDLIARLAQGPLEWSLQAQRFVDEAQTPIEDASVVWPEENSPFHELARVVLPRQSITSVRGQEIEALVEQLSFDPWHAVEALRPLGAVMRARNHAYRESTQERKAAGEPETVLAPG